ncbi:hypothetical protein KFL_001720070 [Klebsormidium nitens]|uniref:Protein YIP n=1 Tax=Klebsormidium nitens TaxID=105231 RepID=A0A0U9HK09_KLENI|nr:hypothetical protein KFL_001720070 [Klebsormidium nitens]|eukprot:GAQ83994.1 hypothetical protein KFL_001720070 [Klebsormidium nitens]
MGPPDEVSVSFDGPSSHQMHPGPPSMQPFNPSQPPPAWSGPGQVPFMSFGQYGNTGNVYAPAPIGQSATYSGGGFDFRDEPPLLEELGINVPLITRKIWNVLHPYKLNTDMMEDGDLSGPILVCLGFASCQLLAGKVHFGVVLGWATLASIFLYAMFNLLAGPAGSVDLYRCSSVMGYSLLPMLLFSAASLLIPSGGLIPAALAVVAVLWSARTCSILLVSLLPQAREQQSLIAYACLLVYTAFALLILF